MGLDAYLHATHAEVMAVYVYERCMMHDACEFKVVTDWAI